MMPLDSMHPPEGDMLDTIFASGGKTGALMRSLDWTQTPLGDTNHWPQSLRTTVSIVVASKFPMAVFWGDEDTQFYNDSFISILADKHPAAMGLPGRITWAEIWEATSNLLNSVKASGEAVYAENLLFLPVRRGFIEEAYFTFSYSPIRAEGGQVEGILATVAETTGYILSGRRLVTLRDLSDRTGSTRTVEEACQSAAEIIAANPADIPFGLIYLISDDRQVARLMSSAGVEPGSAVAPRIIDLTGAGTGAWRLDEVLKTGTVIEVNDLPARFDPVPQGTWSEPVRTALILPISAAGSAEITGFFIAGASSRLPVDDNYRSFFNLVSGHLATAIASTRAYEAEQKRAEALAELDRAKTLFFNNVSHEFRTPLTLMLSPLEELLSHDNASLKAEQIRETLQLVQRSGLRLLKLVNTLLDFARMESERVEMSFEPVDLAAYTAELASMFRSIIERAGLRLVVDCPPVPEPVYIDREMWEKIVLNLLSNAFKFTLSGAITVRLVALENQVELEVQDTGIGIDEADVPNLFQRFYRVPHTQARTYEGSGIGLSLVQDLVRLHGGSIRVTSQFGQGTTFTIALPRGHQLLPSNRMDARRTQVSTRLGARPYLEEANRWLPEPVREPEAVEIRPSVEREILNSRPGYAATGDARVVVVEDNADMRDYMIGLLQQHWHVTGYPDGQSALTKIEQQPPDLVLSDVMMPGMDGFALLRALRAHSETQDIPVILLSARAGEEATIEGLDAGADDYLVKPFTARELLARVNSQLAMTQLRRQMLDTERTARNVAEAESSRSNSILNSMSDAFVVLDQHFRFTYLNPKAQALYLSLTGETVEAFLGNVIWDKFPGSQESIFGVTYQRALHEQIPLTVEAFFAPLNTWFEVRVYPGEAGLSIYFQDITARKEVEKALELYSRSLKRSNEELDQFASIASHDLQGPLRTITSYLQLLERYYEGVLDQDGQEFLNYVLEGAARMKALINDLLTYSRVRSEEASFVLFETENALKTALYNLQSEIDTSQAQITWEALPVIKGDERQFVQLFQNLLSNAIKFRGVAAPEIQVSARRDGNDWLFAVRDNGIGIQPQYLERVFQMFQRLHNQEQYPGTGIGLAICKKVVEHHQGRLWAASEPGKGTTFNFTIPA